MKVTQLALFLALVAIVVVGWYQTMTRLGRLEREVANIEARPLTLQDDTKRCLEDLCKKVASESATETKSEMSDKFKASLDQFSQEVMESKKALGMLAEAVSNDWNLVCGEMLSDGKECLRMAKDESMRTCEAVREDSQKCLQATENAIAKIENQMKSRSDAYLAAARGETNDFQVCELLYRAAVLLAEDKHMLLS